jgi:predicted membrane protein
MGFLFSGIFWGVVLILVGVSLIIRIVFNINIPVFRIVLALILIYLGLQVLLGGTWTRSGSSSVIFQSGDLKITGESHKYSVVFGSSRIDASMPLAKENDKLEVNTIFGSSVLEVPSDIPVLIKVSAAFSSAKMPDGNLVSFGDYTYKNKAFDKSAPYRFIKASVVFGSMTIRETSSKKVFPETAPRGENSDSL